MHKQLTRGTHRLAYEVHGHGAPPLLFVHGWCSRRSHWRAQLAHFGRTQRVAAIDRRGHGESSSSLRAASSDSMREYVAEHTPECHASDLEALLQAEAFEPAVVIGHAGGAASVLVLARRAPERVRALVLVDARLQPALRLDHPGDAAGAALADWIRPLEGRDGARALERMYREFFRAPDSKLAQAAIAEAIATPLSVASAELRGLTSDTLAMARALEQPVLWLSAGPADEAALAAAIRDVRFAVADSGHFPHLEQPARVNAMIEGFVASL